MSLLLFFFSSFLTKLTGENIDEKTAKISDEARLDNSAVGFLSHGQRVFCDIRVFEHTAQRYRNNNLQKLHHKRSIKEETLQRTCVEC